MMKSHGIKRVPGKKKTLYNFPISQSKMHTLMYQLIESVLPIRPWLAPNDRARIVSNATAAASNVFAIAFHIPLLKVGGEAVHVLKANKQFPSQSRSNPKFSELT